MDEIIYLDRSQCERFGTRYRDPGARLVCAASTLLSSKDYDQKHRDILEPLGSSTLVLVAAHENGPGWFAIRGVF